MDTGRTPPQPCHCDQAAPPLPSESVSAMGAGRREGGQRQLRQHHRRDPAALTVDEELRVALAIFMAVSTLFEDIQRSTDPIVRSSFSEEDLPSNLIGFYVEAICDA